MLDFLNLREALQESDKISRKERNRRLEKLSTPRSLQTRLTTTVLLLLLLSSLSLSLPLSAALFKPFLLEQPATPPSSQRHGCPPALDGGREKEENPLSCSGV